MYALVDCNNFYVSCERIFDLSLANRPVAILSNNDGCVISRSNELKALGIKMGVPFFQLKPLLERFGIAVRSSNYELYGDMSRRVMTVLGDFTPEVEPYSIDEAFLHLTLPQNTDFYDYGRQIRAKVGTWTGIPVGVGIAPTRTLAKIANHIAKKSQDGVFVMPDDASKVLKDLPVGEVWGIGRRLVPKLAIRGIFTAAQLRELDDSFLRKKFNVCVARTALELRGVSALEAENVDEPSKSVSCSRSFGHPVTDLSDLCEAVSVYASTAAQKLRKEHLKASGANVYLQYFPEYGNVRQEGGFCTASIVLEIPSSDTAEILGQIKSELPAIFKEGRRYKKAGVIFFGLESSSVSQPDLFGGTGKTHDKLYEAVDSINRKFGKKAIFHLGEGIQREWSMKREHLSPSYTTDWSQLPIVK